MGDWSSDVCSSDLAASHTLQIHTLSYLAVPLVGLYPTITNLLDGKWYTYKVIHYISLQQWKKIETTYPSRGEWLNKILDMHRMAYFVTFKRKTERGFPSGPVVGTLLPLQGAQVQSLVGELSIPQAAQHSQKYFSFNFFLTKKNWGSFLCLVGSYLQDGLSDKSEMQRICVACIFVRIHVCICACSCL